MEFELHDRLKSIEKEFSDQIEKKVKEKISARTTIAFTNQARWPPLNKAL